jgi:hypothetical protein
MANAHARKVVGQWHRQQLAHQVVQRLMATIQRCQNITTHRQRKRRILSRQHNVEVGEDCVSECFMASVFDRLATRVPNKIGLELFCSTCV